RPGSCTAGGARGALPGLRAVDHHEPRAAGCARRAQAGPPPDSFCNAAIAARPRRRLQEGRTRGRRRGRQVPPARRPVDLRRAGAPGAGFRPALSAGRRAGQFWHIDGDNPAAMRYTEARLTEVARLLLEGIDEDAVDFRPTYDGESSEPVVLPGAFPNLLANG